VSDFADIFEVRGIKRAHRGRRLPELVETNSVVLGYEGLDGVIRRTRIECDPAPQQCSASELVLAARLQPQESTACFLMVTCEVDALQPSTPSTYDQALAEAERKQESLKGYDCIITTTNTQVNDRINRAQADLHMMMTETPTGLYPYAGVPWFSTTFGRDGLITALASL
jgi:glycogen debranching enzyme